jgi:hypothetical protein
MSRDSRQRCPETRHCQPDRCDVAGHGSHLFRDIILVCGVFGDPSWLLGAGSRGWGRGSVGAVSRRTTARGTHGLAGRRTPVPARLPADSSSMSSCPPPLVIHLTAARHGSPMASVTCPRRRPPSSLDVEDGKRWLGGGLRCRRSPPRSRAPDFTPRPGSQSEVAFRQAALRGSATSRAGRLRRGAQVASSANGAGTSSICRGAPWRRERRSSG